MIAPSRRLARVRRIFDPYRDRSGLVRLDRNEDPVGWDAAMFDAFKASLTPHDFSAYADSTRLTEKLARWLEVDPSRIAVTAGSDAALKTIFETYIDPGNGVVMQQPGWAMYGVYNDIYQGRALHVPYGQHFEFDVGALVGLIEREAPRMVLLANPNQPTGTVLGNEALELIAQAASSRDALMVVDEAYYGFSGVTALGLVERYPNALVVRTFSKAFGLAGLRLGYCVADARRIKELSLLRPVTDSNSIALKCAEFALDHVDWVRNRVASFVAGRDYLYRSLLERGVEAFEPHCNFVLARCNSMQDAVELIGEMKSLGYLIKGPYGFAPVENCVRITVGPPDLMQKFIADCGALFARRAGAARRTA